jgi:hypothetical protein
MSLNFKITALHTAASHRMKTTTSESRFSAEILILPHFWQEFPAVGRGFIPGIKSSTKIDGVLTPEVLYDKCNYANLPD